MVHETVIGYKKYKSARLGKKTTYFLTVNTFQRFTKAHINVTEFAWHIHIGLLIHICNR